ncbi:VanZ family protein [Halorubrum sp. HHNYT27]|uniref:VanZ family protein n=1 Tax=Halorubrum sp. HHNYT27 TaxID=3402275 RepID=UPI003EBE55F6
MTETERRPRSDPDHVEIDSGPGALRRGTVAVAFAVVAFVASIVPGPTGSSVASGGSGGELGDALPADVGVTAPFHFVGYAVLAALLVRAAGSDRGQVITVAVAAVTATAFGLGVEFVQAPIPWRSFSWGDVAVNAAGAVVGAGASAMTTRLYALGRSLR